MEILNLNEAKIILDDKGNGSGELIIAATWGYNFSTYWGSMGIPMKEFICGINADYFVGRLVGPDDRPIFDGKATMTAVRKAWRETMPWYNEKESQKEIREDFKRIEQCETQERFVDEMFRLRDKYCKPYYPYDIRTEMEFFVEEPWHYIQTSPSHKAIWLRRLHADLVKLFKAEQP